MIRSIKKQKQNTSDKDNWLQELSNQSWNLELIVSGAAIFSTSFLPGIVDDAANYFLDNFRSNDEVLNYVLPILATSLSKGASYLLIFAFFIHFIYRGFWIALVGLRAVYPQGIVVKRIPNATEEVKKTIMRKFGSFDAYIIGLDKKCSQIFSIAFVLVLFNILMVLIYGLGFIFLIGFKTYFPDLYISMKPFLKWFVIIGSFSSFCIALIGMSKKLRENSVLGKILNSFIDKSSFMYLGLYKPINFINYVFASNISLKRYMFWAYSGMLLFFAIGFYIFINVTITMRGGTIGETRSFFKTGDTPSSFSNDAYDNLRSPENRIAPATIQSDIIQDPFIKLFIKYEKILDQDLSKICSQPSIPDSFGRQAIRVMTDSLHLICFHQLFQISLNDSIIQNDFLFDTHRDRNTKGVITYIDTKICREGKNQIKIKKLDQDPKKKGQYKDHYSIPFWYSKKD
jgi:hypothetical protein